MLRLKARFDELWSEKENERCVRQRRLTAEGDDEEWIDVRKISEDANRDHSAKADPGSLQKQGTMAEHSRGFSDLAQKAEQDVHPMQRSRGIFKESAHKSMIQPGQHQRHRGRLMGSAMTVSTATKPVGDRGHAIQDRTLRTRDSGPSIDSSFALGPYSPEPRPNEDTLLAMSDILQLGISIHSGAGVEEQLMEVDCRWTMHELRKLLADTLRGNCRSHTIRFTVNGYDDLEDFENMTISSFNNLCARNLHVHLT